jgi:hypothetical protein
MDACSIMRCSVAPVTSRCDTGLPFHGDLTKPAEEEETEGEDEDSNIDEDMAKTRKKYGVWVDDLTYVSTVE